MLIKCLGNIKNRPIAKKLISSQKIREMEGSPSWKKKNHAEERRRGCGIRFHQGVDSVEPESSKTPPEPCI